MSEEGKYIPANFQWIKTSEKRPDDFNIVLFTYKIIDPQGYSSWHHRTGLTWIHPKEKKRVWFGIGSGFNTPPTYWAMINDPIEEP